MLNLIDTHTFIWWDSEPSRLSPKVLDVLQDPSSVVLLSVVSLWEIMIKLGMGKITLHRPLAEIVGRHVADGLSILTVTSDHVFDLANLPDVHKDPFDRLLISQARVEDATLLSADRVFDRYPVRVLW